MNADEAPIHVARRLLDCQGLTGEFDLEVLPGGRNNRVWRIRRDGTDFLLKKYYWAENDQRDRMGHEWDFLTYLRSIGCVRAPQAFEADRENRSALLEFVPGKAVALSEVGEVDVLSAGEFFSEMNAGRFSKTGLALPVASEACFSLAAHVATTERRIHRLEQITDKTARAFVEDRLLPLWEKTRARILDKAAGHGGMGKQLDSRERCLSPSDFGFHNAIRTPSGALRFVDFEYAGWDDPAKTIADFANQPDRLLEARLSGIFRDRALALFPESERLAARLRLLTPLYQIKWACICLNEFLPSGSHRRSFTGRGEDDAALHLSGHLERAVIMRARAESSLDRPGF